MPTTTTTTTTLTDRYVWAVVRTQPEAARADLEAELRERIADAIDARLADGVQEDVVERVVLTELGDPDRLAASYSDRPLQLIGPRYYLAWRRLLRLLLWIVLPIVAVAVPMGQVIGGEPVGTIVWGAIWIPFTVGIHLCFWVTLVFAILDRMPQRIEGVGEWSPEQLPELPTSQQRMSRGELTASLVFLPLVAVTLVWQQFNPFVRDAEGAPIPALDPALWTFWLPYLLVLMTAEVVFAIALHRRGGWDWGFAIVNVLLNAAFAVPALWLLTTGQLVNPAFVEAVAPDVEADSWRVVTVVLVFVFGALAAWDTIDGFLKLRRDSRR